MLQELDYCCGLPTLGSVLQSIPCPLPAHTPMHPVRCWMYKMASCCTQDVTHASTPYRTAYLLVESQRLLCHEARLGHRSLHRVHQQQHTVAHVEDTLHLTTEICVTWGVNHIDLGTLVPAGVCVCVWVGGGAGGSMSVGKGWDAKEQDWRAGARPAQQLDTPTGSATPAQACCSFCHSDRNAQPTKLAATPDAHHCQSTHAAEPTLPHTAWTHLRMHPPDGCVLCQDGDTAFTLQRVAVHHTHRHVLHTQATHTADTVRH